MIKCLTLNSSLFFDTHFGVHHLHMVHFYVISVTQPGYPQPSVPVYSYGPPMYLGKNQQAVGRNNISIIDC